MKRCNANSREHHHFRLVEHAGDPPGRILQYAMELLDGCPHAAAAACTIATAVLATVADISPERIHNGIDSAFVELADRVLVTPTKH